MRSLVPRGCSGWKAGPLRALLAPILAVVLAAMVVAQAELLVNRDGMFYAGTDRPVGGDFLVFYAAGRIVAAGAGSELYRPARQLQEQQHILGRDRGLAIFPYPAFVAAPYALLALTSMPVAYAIATIAMATATLFAALLLRAVVMLVRAHFALILLMIFSSQPFAAALLGGQPVALAMLCFAGIYCGMRVERPLTAGIWLGLLAYKPQLAATLVVILGVQGHWRMLAAAALVVASLLLVGMLVAGPAWPAAFFNLVFSDYYRDNAILVDGVRSISVPALIGHVAGKHTLLTGLVCALLDLSLLAILLRLWRRAGAGSEQFPLQFAAVIVLTLIVSPHALFYEAALLVLPLLLLADHWRRLGRLQQHLPLLAALFGLGYLWPLAPTLGFEPLALLTPLLAVLIWRELAACRNPAQVVAITPGAANEGGKNLCVRDVRSIEPPVADHR
jgi:alpha-1,2-mannosyltransferase